MTAPDFTLELDLHSRPFPFRNRAAERLDQRLDVGELNRSRRGPGKYCGECLAVFCIHGQMLS